MDQITSLLSSSNIPRSRSAITQEPSSSSDGGDGIGAIDNRKFQSPNPLPLEGITADNWRTKLWEYASSNALFSAGAGLMALTVAGAYARKLLVVGKALLLRRFVSTLEVDNNDRAYQWVLEYINKHSRSQTNKLTVNTMLEQSESGRLTSGFIFMPGRCDHYFRFGGGGGKSSSEWGGGRFVKVSRTREQHSLRDRDGARHALETVTLTTLAPSMAAGAAFWHRFLAEVSRDALSKVETGLVIYRAVGPEWRRLGPPRRKRPLASIVLDTGVKERLQRDFEEFLSSQQWYTDRGVPYRRGYLLYGPHGTGKSSFISALAGHYGYSICTLSMSDRTLDDDRFGYLLNTLPKNSILLLEDIDAATRRKGKKKLENTKGHEPENEELENEDIPAYEGLSRVTYSGLTNALDGVTSGEERIVFMTTNHYGTLDRGLIRPGRVDVQQEFGNCTPVMLEKMFLKFYGEQLDRGNRDELAVKFREACLREQFSPAEIQGHLLLYKEQPEEAIRRMLNKPS